MTQLRRVLVVDDSADDAELSLRALRRAGWNLTYERVETPDAMREALERGPWDLVISDYSMPKFDGLAALKLLRGMDSDIPFILVSGAVGEDVAVEAMKSGADDYVLKSNLVRLPLAVERELRDRAVRVERNQAEARYRTLVDRVPIGLFSTSPTGIVIDANPAMAEILGFKESANLKGMDLPDFWLDPEQRDRLREIANRDRIIKNYELRVRRADHAITWCEVSARGVFDADDNLRMYEGVIVDITARKLAEAEANRVSDQVRDLALESARQRSDFMARMSHEIRTPLAAIIGTGELLARTDMSPDQRRQTDTIRTSGELLLTVVNDILDFSKLQAGRVTLEKLEFDLVELSEGLIDSFGVAARARKIELALCIDAAVPTGLRGDQNRLRQVLNNLVSNAIKFTERGEVSVRVSLAESAGDDVLVRFDISDSGIGIPLEAQARLFQPFIQAEGSTSRRFGGTGLGLVIAARLIEQMGGEIGFESEAGKGSNFHFTLRLEKGVDVIHPWMSVEALSCFENTRAIIVNDNPASRLFLGRYLTAWRVENLVVANGVEALEMLKQDSGPAKRTFVLIDERVSGMDAFSLAHAIKSQSIGKPPPKVIVFSAETPERATTGDVDAWITKPTRPSHLFSRMLELSGAVNRVAGVRSAPPALPDADCQPPWRKDVRVLLVDDNLVNRTIGAQQLSVLGYSAKVVDGARRGLDVVSRGDSDIVLMDCEMPEMDGYQAVAEIRRSEGSVRHTVVIALTAHATESDRGRCLDAGMDDYLSKPVRLQTLALMLDTWAQVMFERLCDSTV